MDRMQKLYRILIILIIINWLCSLLNIFNTNANSIYLLGFSVTDSSLVEINNINLQIRNDLVSYKIWGNLLGNIIYGFIIIAVFFRKNWARLLLLLGIIFTLIYLLVNFGKFLNLYTIIKQGVWWPGLIILIITYVFGFIYNFALLIIFTNPKIKILFVNGEKRDGC